MVKKSPRSIWKNVLAASSVFLKAKNRYGDGSQKLTPWNVVVVVLVFLGDLSDHWFIFVAFIVSLPFHILTCAKGLGLLRDKNKKVNCGRKFSPWMSFESKLGDCRGFGRFTLNVYLKNDFKVIKFFLAFSFLREEGGGDKVCVWERKGASKLNG